MTATEPEHERERQQEGERERSRLDEIFGDVLPESTRDDQDESDQRDSGQSTRDADLLRDVPPHHG
jgi:hypothetical protein